MVIDRGEIVIDRIEQFTGKGPGISIDHLGRLLQGAGQDINPPEHQVVQGRERQLVHRRKLGGKPGTGGEFQPHGQGANHQGSGDVTPGTRDPDTGPARFMIVSCGHGDPAPVPKPPSVPQAGGLFP
jgi:hypothetical protein